MSHIKLKASKEIKIDFNSKELVNSIIPEESKIFTQKYLSSKILAENLDLMLMFEDTVVFGFDYFHAVKED